MDEPQAKAKVRDRHRQAIAEFQRWKRQHPKAKLAKQIQVFDAYIDDASPPTMKTRKRASTPA